MVEKLDITIGKAPENEWRRNNLLKAHNCVDKGTHFEVPFQWIEHTKKGVVQINLIYTLIK